MMGVRRIRYMLRAFDRPFGGPQQIRRHVRMLCEAGHDAAIVIDSDKDAHFYGEPVPRILDRDFRATAEDICVVPEGWRRHALSISQTPAALVCFCQNHYTLSPMFAPGESFATFRIQTVACCSRQTANFVERFFDAERVDVIPCAVDPGSASEERKSLAIACMPRKAPFDLGFLRDVFRRKHSAHGDIPWVPIDGASHADALATLGRCAVFLSMSHREGFGLPPVEAMSAGALVVGFHGGGGLDYATPRNGLWIEEGDLIGCSDALAEALDLLRSERGEVQDLIDEGRRTASRYTPSMMRDTLLRFWTRELA